MTPLSGVLSTVLLASAPPPVLTVCVVPRWVDVCTDPSWRVEAEIRAWGLTGSAEVIWVLDGKAVHSSRVRLEEGEIARVPLEIDNDNATHRLGAHVTAGAAAAQAVLQIHDGPPACPYDLEAHEVLVVEGVEVVGVVRNRGPSPSGRRRVRWVLNERIAYDSLLDSLPPGALYELVLPWRQAPRRGRVRLELDSAPEELDRSNDVFEIDLRAGSGTARP